MKERTEETWWAVRVNPLDSDHFMCGICRNSQASFMAKHGRSLVSHRCRWGLPDGTKCHSCGKVAGQ